VAEIAAKGIAPMRTQAEATDAAARIARGVVCAAKTIPDADLAAVAYDVGSGLSRGAAPESRDALIAAAAEALKAEGLSQDTVRYFYEGALAAEDLPTIEVPTPPEGSSGENGAKGN
jgi:predicted nucleic acid-binding protein